MTRFPVDGTGRLSSEREHPTADLVGPAGGDLAGSYPNPTITTINGHPAAAVISATASTGRLNNNGSNGPVLWAKPPSGDTSGATDEAMLNAMIASLADSSGGSGGGGEIQLMPGIYYYTSLVANFYTAPSTRLRGLRIRGFQGGGGCHATELRYVGSAGAARAIDARSSQGFELVDLSLGFSVGLAFTGYLIDYTHDTSGIDAASGKLVNCRIGYPVYDLASPQLTAAALVNWAQAIFMTARDCTFQGAKIGIQGIDPAVAGYSNGHVIDACEFDNLATAGITNMGQQCAIVNPRVEGTQAAGGAHIPLLYLDNQPPGAFCYGLQILDTWCGDNPVGFFDSGTTAFVGMSVDGGLITGLTNAAFIFRKGGRGLKVAAVSFGGPSAIDLGSSATGIWDGVDITANDFIGVTGAPVLNQGGHHAVNIRGNSPRSGENQTEDQLYIAGHVITDQARWITPTITKEANLGSTATATITGNDTCGTIALTSAGTGQAAGDCAFITWAAAFDSNQNTGKLPRMILQPHDSDSAAISIWAHAFSASQTNLGFVNAPIAGKAYTFDYWVAQ